MKTLFVTEVGSRMWGMDDLASDYDLVEIYQDSTKDILTGKSISTSLPCKQYTDEMNRLIDKQYMEIGHIINLLCKGNINAIWAITSPLVHKNYGYIGYLRYLVENNLSKYSYNSINGMALSQEKDATKRGVVRESRKSRLTALRTLKFGIELLQHGTLNFNVMSKYEPREDVSYEELDVERKKLLIAYTHSTLPEMVDEKPFREYLYNLRMEDLS